MDLGSSHGDGWRQSRHRFFDWSDEGGVLLLFFFFLSFFCLDSVGVGETAAGGSKYHNFHELRIRHGGITEDTKLLHCGNDVIALAAL